MSGSQSEAALAPVITHSEEGQIITAFGDIHQFKLTGEQSGGSLVVSLVTIPPGGGPPPHVHRQEDEIFLMLEGRFSIFVNGVWTDVTPGDVVYTPRGNIHCFRNVGDSTGRFWLIVTPSGFERFIAKCADVFSAPGPPDMQRIMQICGEHDVEMVQVEDAAPH